MMRRHAGREGGAALLVAMVLIFMLSIMGVSVMRSSAIEKRMATNAAQSTTTLYAAESVTEQMLNSSAVLRDAGQNRRVVRTVPTSSVCSRTTTVPVRPPVWSATSSTPGGSTACSVQPFALRERIDKCLFSRPLASLLLRTGDGTATSRTRSR